MPPDTVKAKVLAAVANGSSVSDAAREHGLTPNQGRDAVARLCRDFRLPADIGEIQTNPKKYLDSASKVAMNPHYALRKNLRGELQYRLQLQSVDELTPKYVSNLTATMLLDSGITETGVADIQEWLFENGTTLKRQAPISHEHMTSVKRAIFLLNSFGFDTTEASSQLSALDG